MIGTDSTVSGPLAEDAVEATARIGIVDVKHGELAVPRRVLDHVHDGPVTVQLHRSGHELARCEAELITNSAHTFGKLAGIEWPDDVTAGTRVTVFCARGAAGHDVAVLLPDVEAPVPGVVEPEAGAHELVGDVEVEQPVDEHGLGDSTRLDEELLLVDELGSPGVEDLAAGETTEVIDVVVDEIGPEYAAGLADAIVHGIDGEDADLAWVEERLRPSPRERLLAPWFWLVYLACRAVDEVAATVRWSARWELEHDRTLARLILATLSLLVLVGAGIGWWLA